MKDNEKDIILAYLRQLYAVGRLQEHKRRLKALHQVLELQGLVNTTDPDIVMKELEKIRAQMELRVM
jgi:hypothetical protein